MPGESLCAKPDTDGNCHGNCHANTDSYCSTEADSYSAATPHTAASAVSSVFSGFFRDSRSTRESLMVMKCSRSRIARETIALFVP